MPTTEPAPSIALEKPSPGGLASASYPKGVPINLRFTWQLVNQPQRFTAQLRQQYGEAVTFFLNDLGFVIALTSEGARQIFSGDPDGYDAFWKEGFSGVAGPGSLWVLSGKQHRQERQLLSPAFHPQTFQAKSNHKYPGYGEIIRQAARQHIDQWRPGQTVRVLDTTLNISLEVILRVVFGVTEGKFIEQGRKVLYELWHTLHPMIVFFPTLQCGWFPPWKRYSRAKDDFSTWIFSYLAERRTGKEAAAVLTPASEASNLAHDILGRMLAARHDDGKPMSDAAIRDELITILLAGHETTATALAWALYELGRHPAELEKLRAEVQALGPNPDPGLVAKLPYLSAICNETLRLHTLLPEVGRVLSAPFNFFEYTLPPGSSVAISIMSIHHDPELYPQPDSFIPERFIKRTYSPFEFMPFGGGHRRCLGAGLSDYEMRITLAEIITRWEFETAAPEREIRHDIAMGPKNGVLLRIKERRNTRKIYGNAG